MLKKEMLFLEIKVRVNGEERWANGRKLFKYLIEEYSEVSYSGKKILPYEERVAKFFDNLPDNLINEWKKAYPNVDIKGECKKARAWLISNTSKAKKDFKRFTNNWLAQAMSSGGAMPIQTDAIIDRQLKEQRERQEELENVEIATDEERREALNLIKERLKNKNKVK
jgi:hypothetical protein